MAELRKILGILIFISGHFDSVSTQSPNVCKTFGSGVIQMFNQTMFHVKSTCPVIMTHFSHAGVDCFISVEREPNGFMNKVKILVNKVVTIIQDGILTVEGNSISLPYDHTYQSVYTFGIYTRLKSKVLPLSVTWYSLPEGVTSLWVQLDQPLVDGMTGICGGRNSSENRAQLLNQNVIHDGICVIGDSQPVEDLICKEFKSQARECLGGKLYIFDQLCKLNMYNNVHELVKCSFYEEFIRLCNGSYAKQSKLRNITSCKEHHCPGDLLFKDYGAAFPPTCSNPQLQTEFLTSTCLPPNGSVLNDRAEGYHCVKVEDCPCVHRGRTYASGQKRTSKCQTCECIKGKWICSANTCPTLCVIEGWFVTTFDGKQYSLPGKCSYVAARGLNWTLTIKFSETTIEEMYLDVYQERYTFSLNSVQLKGNEITPTDLSQTEHATIYWLSSMFVMVQTTFGMKMQVQVSPEVQMYLYVPQTVMTRGLCGSYNNNTEDDFTTSSGIVENSAQPFALSWALGDCTPNNPLVCINTDNEIFAEDQCSQLTNASGVFAQCHDYVPVNTYFDACVLRTCQATSNLQEHICIGLGNYAKACTSQGINIGDWREETACTHSCNGNLKFEYSMQACNHTCRSLSGPDPACDMPVDPVEGCGCPSGTHLNTPFRCSPRALCYCSYPGGTTPPGAIVIDGRQCMCANGNLQCSDVCDCPPGQICVHCAQAPVNTEHRTCESLSKPSSTVESCVSGCYCPEGQYADHTGSCVTQENCTCEFSGMVYASGQSVESNCKTCTCRGGQWNCQGDPCPGVCEVFGNGQYKTFDSKWYRFDGHCQYTLVEDIHGLFSIKAESVPCCDEVLTCSRSISVKLMDEVTLILRDMNVTQKLLDGWHVRAHSLYSVHTVGLYIIISVPELGLNVIWDKQTKVKIELQASWNGKVRGLCGDFDGKLMNDMMTSSSTVVFSTLEFGNSWKAAVPPCSDVTQELFPCERHSYCAAWSQRRCMILHSDTFKDCHLKVDPSSYYQACVLESCSCDFEGKFLGFCTAVAAYADACRTQNVCIKWRTPDLCPVYCDYYNEEGQCSWHYEACPYQIKTCGKDNKFFRELEGCYPRCPAEMPYYDENRRICSRLDNCTCYFNNTVVEPGAKVTTPNECCDCIGGQIICGVCATQLPTKTTSVPAISTALKTTTPLTTTKTPLTTIVSTPQTTQLDIKTGAASTSATQPQINIFTPATPTTTTTKTTEKTMTTTQLTTITTEITTKPKITTEKYKTEVPLTTKTETSATTSTPKITTVHKTTNTLTTALVTTTIPEMTTEESASTTPESRSTTRITTEEPKTTTQFTTTTETPVTTTIPITTEESESTTPESRPTTRITTGGHKTTTLFTTTTETPLTTTISITTEESEFTTPEIRASTVITTGGHKTTTPFTTTTETPVTTVPGITTEESLSTMQGSTSTTRITTEEPKTTTQFTTTTETPVTTTISITTEESESTTPEIRTSTIITTERHKTTTPFTTTTTTTKTPVTTTVPGLTTEEFESTSPEFRASTIITTEGHKTTTPFTTTTEALVTTTIPGLTTEESLSTMKGYTSTTRITTEEPKTTTQFTTTTETPVTTTISITTEESESTTPEIRTSTIITTERHKTTTPFTTTTTTTKTPVTTTVPGLTTEEFESTSPEFRASTIITTEGHKTTTPLTTTTEALVTTAIPELTTEESLSTMKGYTSTTRITTEEPKTTTQFTTTTETPVTTTISISTEESEFTTPEIRASTIITTEGHKTTTPFTTTTTTTKTPVTTTVPGLTTEESESTTPEFKASTIITTEGHKTTTPLTTTTETPVTTTIPGLTTEESLSTMQGYTLTTKSTTEEPKTTTQFTTTTEALVTTTFPGFTPEESESTTLESKTTTRITTDEHKKTTPFITTGTTVIPKITTVHESTMSETSEIPLTTTSTITETTVTTTSIPEITTEQPKTTETTVTSSTLKTSPVPTTALTTTTLTTTPPPPTSVPKNTNEAFTSISSGITTTETPLTTTKMSYEEPKITTLLTTSESSVTTATPNNTTILKPTSPITTTTTEILITTSAPEITTGELASTSPLTTPESTQPNIYTEATSTLFSQGPQVLTTTSGPTTTKITEKPITTTSLTTNTTETIVITTSTPKMTTVLKTTAPLTTASKTHTTTTSPGILTTSASTSTTPFTRTLTTTKTPVHTSETKTEKPYTTTPLTTTPPPLTTITTPKPTTVPSTGCKDLIRNQSWPEGYEWTEDCFIKICINSVIELRPMVCPTSVMPVCPRGMPKLVKDKQGCCDTWQCDCQCDVFGDPHYTTFAGQDFTFLENCTYVLVEERISHHYLSISVDNYYCEPSASCAKGIILKYHNNTVILQVLQNSEEMPVLETSLNQVTIKPPYQADGLRFESTDTEIYIYIEEIRSYVFLSIWNTLQINLAMEYFLNNTQGQCGVCGGASCTRRDGSVESEDCCEKTALEWIQDEPLKPYCQQSQRHVPCFPDKSPTSPPVIVPPPCMAPSCDLLRHEVFSECSSDIDVEKLVSNCKFDYCVAQNNATVCSTLERLADHCKKMGICVAWRNLTNGICDITCPEGMILDECRSTPTDFCRGGVRVPGTALDTVRSGCFCPGNQLLAETHKKICVSECTNCKGPLGEPMPVGAIWESNCHICTCNNQTLTEECWPKPSAPTPTCSPDSTLISDCCNSQICVEKTCEYNGTIYKVGEMWRDNQNPCVTFRCTREGTEIKKNVCPQLFCPEELRVWDEHHCCYSCNTTCGVRLSKMTVENCTQEVMLPTCEGNCGSMWVRSGKDLQYNQICCRERSYETRQISLVCSGATAMQYTYKHITSCECHADI